jgi:hypothetical protein
MTHKCGSPAPPHSTGEKICPITKLSTYYPTSIQNSNTEQNMSTSLGIEAKMDIRPKFHNGTDWDTQPFRDIKYETVLVGNCEYIVRLDLGKFMYNKNGLTGKVCSISVSPRL